MDQVDIVLTPGTGTTTGGGDVKIERKDEKKAERNEETKQEKKPERNEETKQERKPERKVLLDILY
jgi:hypothetical protein